MADARRAEFPRPDRPLYTPDADAQRQVVARIKQGRQGKPQDGRNKRTQEKADYVVIPARQPMGQHPFISYERLASEWGVSRPTAKDKTLNPQKIDPYETYVLCECLGVTLEWLRGWTDENAYGRYESADTIAALYDRLSDEDRETISALIKRLAGADAVAGVKHERWLADHREWAKRHPAEVARVREDIKRAAAQTVGQVLAGQLVPQTARQEILKTTALAAAANAAVIQPAFDLLRSAVNQYTPEEWQLIEETASRLESVGIDADGMTPAQLLEVARGDSMNEKEDAPS